ncbi:protein cycle isoform X3 [Nilaparvata lugens]|nr:protein cycle isoform X3 [Nilaparvata lugens]XP_039286560.1 protein cycle isoform X3 [Nilaparvata lugens]
MFLGSGQQQSASSASSVQQQASGGAATAGSGGGGVLHSMELAPQVDSTRDHPSKKRKAPSYHDGSDFDDDTGDDSKSVRTDDNKKQNHSEIEKRRRDKMNTYITELSAMVPMCYAMSRKLDKLTVLRMAVQHLKTIRGAVQSYTEGHYKPSFLSDQELKHLILQVAAEGFLFVVGCDRGRILYVSESVSQVLHYSQGDLLGQSWFDILHPKDVAKVKEQLSASDLSPRERLIDAKTMLPVKTDVPQGVSRLCPGARRSFFCRMKCKSSSGGSGGGGGGGGGGGSIKEEQIDSSSSGGGCHRRKKQTHADKKQFSVVQCTGYLKSWAPTKSGGMGQEQAAGSSECEAESEADGDGCNLSCLVAVGRLLPPLQVRHTPSHAPPHDSSPSRPKLRTIQFISRHAMDGKFLFVDQRATMVLGFLPQELLGTSMYEYYHHEDISRLADSHKAALQGPPAITTHIYRFRSKDGSFVQLQSEWKSFRNPWTKDVEYLVAKNSLVMNEIKMQSDGPRVHCEETSQQNSFDFFASSQNNGGIGGRDMSRLISSHVEASKIGRQIAEEVFDLQRRGVDSPSSHGTPSPQTDQSLSVDSQSNNGAKRERTHRNSSCNNNNNYDSSYESVRNNVILSSAAAEPEAEVADFGLRVSPACEQTEAGVTTEGADGNDEMAMAVIMSLLEADAGLGGPVDFSGFPWPLP